MSDNGITRRRVLAGTGATLASGGVLFATTSGTAEATKDVVLTTTQEAIEADASVGGSGGVTVSEP